jgi:hypothetical protein
MSAEEKTVVIFEARLRELEALEASLPDLIARAKVEANQDRFAALRDRDKANPDGLTKRVLKHYHAHKDEINARRREKRRLAKEAAAAGGQTPTA